MTSTTHRRDYVVIVHGTADFRGDVQSTHRRSSMAIVPGTPDVWFFFNQPIAGEVWPSFLKKLTFEDNFNQPIAGEV